MAHFDKPPLGRLVYRWQDTGKGPRYGKTRLPVVGMRVMALPDIEPPSQIPAVREQQVPAVLPFQCPCPGYWAKLRERYQ